MRSTLRVLLIDSNAGEARLSKRMLERGSQEFCFDCVHVVSLGEAVRTLHEKTYDAVLTELDLVDSRGLATLERLVSCIDALEESSPSILLWLTHLEERQVHAAVEAGANECLFKDKTDDRRLVREIWMSVQQRLAVRKLVNARTEAVKAAEERSRFSEYLSHELRTPLNAVLGMTEALSETPLSAQQQDYVQTLRRAGRILLDQVNGVLDLARIEAGKLSPKKEAFFLKPMVADLVGLFDGLAERKGLVFKTSVAEDLPSRVVGDAVRIRQVLINLIANAIKYTEQGQVALRLSRSGRDILFEVEDTGPGLTEAERQRLFIPFETLGESSIQSTGLGLSLSRRLVALWQGSIRVKSKKGHGSIFSFTHPLVEGAVSLSVVKNSEPQTASASLRVLWVDDEYDNYFVAKTFARSAGLDIEYAASGEQALLRLARTGEKFDCIAVDRRMPGMGGAELIKRVRATRGFEGIRILAVTADLSPASHQSLRSAGADDVLTKPFSKETFLAAFAKTGSGSAAAHAEEEAFLLQLGVEYRAKKRAELGQVGQWLVKKEMESVSGWAHQLAGSSANFGLADVGTLARKLEASATLGDRVEAGRILQRIKSQLA